MNYIEYTFEFKEPQPWSEVLMTYLSDLAFESFDQKGNILLAYGPEEKIKADDVEEVLTSLDYEDIISSFKVIQDENWNAEWEKNFDPIFVGDKCVIRAPFHTIDKTVDFDLIIEPQMSFGTGHHQTTYLMTSHLLNMDLADKTVLDMGCGTGVLAILAIQRKAKDAVAIDIDEWAYENTKANILLNNTQNIEVLKGGAELLHENTKFDVIIANINRNILLADFDKYDNVLKSGGKLLMSGFYSTDIEVMDKAANQFKLTRTNTLDKEGWAMLEYSKK